MLAARIGMKWVLSYRGDLMLTLDNPPIGWVGIAFYVLLLLLIFGVILAAA